MPARIEQRGNQTYIVIGDQLVRCTSHAAAKRLLDAIRLAYEPRPPSSNVPTGRVATEEEVAARYLVRDFHDWFLQGVNYLEPGFQDLVGQSERVITIHYERLRDDWEDDFRRSLDRWADACGFDFREASDAALADVVVDDEKKGAFAIRRFQTTGRYVDGKAVVRSAAREINIWKEWGEWNLEHAMTHEIGHVLGLGHPGPYNGTMPLKPHSAMDHTKHTVMSYFGNPLARIGDVDKIAIEMIYNA